MVISPAFFGYEQDIVSAFRRAGWDADFFDERPSNVSLVRAILRRRPDLLRWWVDWRFSQLLRECHVTTYQCVLIIKAEETPGWFVSQLRKAQPTARVYFYTFDKLSVRDNCQNLLHLADRCYTFDRDDSTEFQQFTYKPLFYTPAYRPPTPEEPPHWEAAFVGTLHSDRYRFATELTSNLRRLYTYFYVPARWYFWFGKYITQEFKGVRYSDVRFHKLRREEVARVFRRSSVVLDVQRFGQSGLTMRTFEVLASGAALVTGNTSIYEEPFYDPKWILVVNRLPDALARERLGALLREHEPCPPSGFEAYSIDSWIKDFTGSPGVCPPE